MYLAYAASLQYVVPQNITLYRYVNDHLASKKAKVSQLPGAIEDLEYCMTEVKSWMDKNHLKMKLDKTEFLAVANTLFVRLPDVDIKELQAVQNTAAKLVLGKAKYDSCTQCLQTLHWLSVKFRIIFRILTMIHKCLNSTAPHNLIDLLTEYIPRRDGETGCTCNKNESFCHQVL